MREREREREREKRGEGEKEKKMKNSVLLKAGCGFGGASVNMVVDTTTNELCIQRITLQGMLEGLI